MGQPVARVGDTTSHGGVIVSGSFTVFTDGIQTVRKGDLHVCPIKGHGVNPVVGGSLTVFADGLSVARVGDTTACGAVIVQGSPTRFAG